LIKYNSNSIEDKFIAFSRILLPEYLRKSQLYNKVKTYGDFIELAAPYWQLSEDELYNSVEEAYEELVNRLIYKIKQLNFTFQNL
jgi:hypothetical protein